MVDKGHIVALKIEGIQSHAEGSGVYNSVIKCEEIRV